MSFDHFFKGERRFDAGNPPTDISNDGLTVLRTVFALKEIHERIATNFLAMEDSDPESDFVRLARDSGVHADQSCRGAGDHP
jgi:hypothetical protein